ncbi:MAG: ATP synthase subunit I [Candidatus Faecousia sp.]|nr:ATP synthase subunit I [Clostridiales bacterium]MDY6180498.1 ATP synthase subunit I [Candidatus Faecousia sp.]
MESRKIVYRETGIVAIGVTVCTAVMMLVYALLGRFDLSVLWGGLMGAVLSIGNFFLMALGTSLAADKAENQDVKGGSLLVRNSYMLRLLVLFVVLILCAKTEVFNLIALVLPLVFVRPTLTVVEFFRKKGA